MIENTITGHSYSFYEHIQFGSEGSIGVSVECDLSIYCKFNCLYYCLIICILM
jgi:hypothetical protein